MSDIKGYTKPTEAQTAYMWLNRAVFKPEDFYVEAV